MDLESVAWVNALEMYLQRPAEETARAVALAFNELPLHERLGPGCGPFLGFTEVAIERGHIPRSLRVRVGLALVRRSMRPERPGWNDYHMIRWQLTRDPRAAAEIHRRAFHLTEWPIVRSIAERMVASVCDQNPEFLAAMKTAAIACRLCAQ